MTMIPTGRLDEEARFIERLIFNNRQLIIILFAALTLIFAWQASKLRPDASFTKMLPTEHPYIRNMLARLDQLGANGTMIQIAVENRQGDIFDPEVLDTVKKVSDELFYIKGVDRVSLKSLWTANVRWTAVTEQGFEGGEIVPPSYDGSAESLAEVRRNVLRSGQVGILVADNFKSTIVQANLYDRDPVTDEALDYQAFSRELESRIRNKYETDNIRIHITGFAKMIGDLMEGAAAIVLFFAIAVVISAILVFVYTRSIRATLATIGCGLIAVIWQIGILVVIGSGLNAYSMLVPFLTFAMATSHSLQKISAMATELEAQNTSLMAARRAFRAVYLPAITALLTDAIGYLTLLIIDIEVIRELSIAAAIGVGVLMFTNIIMLPVVISYIGIEPRAVIHMKNPRSQRKLWTMLSYTASKRWAPVIVFIGAGLYGIAWYGSTFLQIGDLDKGAPELRPDSRYNLDTVFINDNYATSSDAFVVMVETPPQGCSSYEAVEAMDRFGWTMENIEGVQSAVSLANVAKLILVGFNEGNLKWSAIPRNQQALDNTFNEQFMPPGLMNADCSFAPIVLFLEDHKAETLDRVAAAAEKFAAQNSTDKVRFVLATGSAGVEAATNAEIRKANHSMTIMIYFVVTVLVFLTFRSSATTLCIMVPLGLTSLLCEALMASSDIGVKIATLPVIALGVGIGVDYGIYIFSRLDKLLRQGLPIQEAYFRTLQSTGKAVAFTGITLAIGVATWTWSPIKFQADMGYLLAFMFLWNMAGAMCLLPAIAYFVLRKPKAALNNDTLPMA